MARPDFVHPVVSQWRRILNERPVPTKADRNDLAVFVPVRARVVWERDGEETKAAKVVATSRVRGYAPLVLVHWTGAEPRSMTLGAWLVEGDVERH